jgi:hypothetical protein
MQASNKAEGGPQGANLAQLSEHFFRIMQEHQGFEKTDDHPPPLLWPT